MRAIKIVIIIAILVVLAGLVYFVALPLYEKQKPGDDRVDLRTYLGIEGDEDVYIMLGEYPSFTQALVRGGKVYWELDSVKRHFADNFWINMDEGLLLLTTADEVVRAEDGERYYTRHAEAFPAEGIEPEIVRTEAPVFFIEKGRCFVELDYAKQFSNFSYELFNDPYRVQIYIEDCSFEAVDVLKNTVVREAMDIKSGIVTDLAAGDKLFVYSSTDEWSSVRTRDALRGYVENKYLSEEASEIEISIPIDYAAPPFTAMTEDRRICIAWDQVAMEEGNAGMLSRVAPAWPLDVISPTWYRITDEGGTVESIASKDYVNDAHARGLMVWPLVDDLFGEFDRTAMLMSTTGRDNLISYLIGQAKELGFDGLNLDFEQVPEEAASGFEQLVRELSVACRAHGLVFSIDNYPPRPRTEHYNRRLQGAVADYVIIMGYDEHYSSASGPGSVSSLPFVIDAIEQTLEVVPANKVINAVPFYTRIWSTDHSDGTVRVEFTVGQRWQDEWITKRNLEPIWSEELGQHYTQIDDNNKTYQIWLENEASMQMRMDAMKERELGGVSCWRLGLEPPAIWDILGEYTRG